MTTTETRTIFEEANAAIEAAQTSYAEHVKGNEHDVADGFNTANGNSGALFRAGLTPGGNQAASDRHRQAAARAA